MKSPFVLVAISSSLFAAACATLVGIPDVPDFGDDGGMDDSSSSGGSASGGSSSGGSASSGSASGGSNADDASSSGGSSSGGSASSGSGSGADASSGGQSSGSSSGSSTSDGSLPDGSADPGTVMPPNLPTVSGTCPTFSAGSATAITVTAGTGTLGADVWGGSKSTGAGGPLILYWHGTGSSPSAEVPVAFNTSQVAADGGLIVGFISTSRTGTTTGNTGDDLWFQSDLAYADQVVACAIQSYNIDPRRIYTAGYSGGALQAVYMWFARSGYIASVVSYSGGDATINEATSQDTSNVAPALVAHGGSGVDELVLDFAQASATWETKITNGGGTYIDCNDGGSHTAFFTTRAPNLEPVAYAFLKAHPFGIKPEPYTSLPSGYPTYCTLNGAGTPPVGGAG